MAAIRQSFSKKAAGNQSRTQMRALPGRIS